ncbi:MAG: hypothetical protein H6636_08875 [Anaerolineales bacterium]|nr:hypothetical protein [Anaerolineales bacterium]
MSDWNEIVENIERAMNASKQFHDAGEALLNHTQEEKVQAFAKRMEELQNELEKIYRIIGPGSPVALDEIVEAFSQTTSGHHAAYRMTPELPPHEIN